MRDRLGYLWEQLTVAADILTAPGDASAAERLSSAWFSSLSRVDRRDVPEQLLADFKTLEAWITSAWDGSPGVGPSPRPLRLSGCEAERLVERVLRLQRRVEAFCDAQAGVTVSSVWGAAGDGQ